jgi:hypothetical protein
LLDLAGSAGATDIFRAVAIKADLSATPNWYIFSSESPVIRGLSVDTNSSLDTLLLEVRMRGIFSASVGVLLFGLTPGTGTTAAMQGPVVIANPAVVFVDGWWEQEHREKDARERYWRLPPEQLNRYHRLQADSDRREQQRRRIDDQNSRARQEQHRLLGFER